MQLCVVETESITRGEPLSRALNLAGHVVDRILVSQPVSTLHRVVEVPAPVILTHVTKCSIDTTLCAK